MLNWSSVIQLLPWTPHSLNCSPCRQTATGCIVLYCDEKEETNKGPLKCMEVRTSIPQQWTTTERPKSGIDRLQQYTEAALSTRSSASLHHFLQQRWTWLFEGEKSYIETIPPS